MPKKAIVAMLVIIAMSGCIQLGEKSLSDLKSVTEKYALGTYIAPGTVAELDSFQKDLLSLKAQAQAKKSRQSEELVALIDYKLAVVQAQRALLNAKEEAGFIDYYDTSCSKETSLKKAINYFDEAAAQAELAGEMASSFQKNYPDYKEEAGFGIAEQTTALNQFKSAMLEKKKAYQQFCT